MAEHDLPPLVLYTDATHPATNKTTHPNYHTVNATPSTPPTYSNDINIDDIARSMPELPAEQRRRLMQSCGEFSLFLLYTSHFMSSIVLIVL